MALFLRLAVGSLFMISGLEKLLGPFQNFLYVIQQYEVVPDGLARVTAAVFPWCELIVGALIVAGLWLPIALRISALMSATLMLIVGQAILRKLPISNCGCFGDLVHLPLQGVLLVDLGMLAAALIALRNLPSASRWSLDRLYAH